MKLVLLGAVLVCLGTLGRGEYNFFQQWNLCDTGGKAPADASCCNSSNDSTRDNQNCCMQGDCVWTEKVNTYADGETDLLYPIFSADDCKDRCGDGCRAVMFLNPTCTIFFSTPTNIQTNTLFSETFYQKDCLADSCYCSTSQASPKCFGMLPITAASISQCCGQLKVRVFQRCFSARCGYIIKRLYEYHYTYFERMGFCRRNPSVTFTRPQKRKPDPLPGPCYCKQEATSCFAPTTPTTTTTTSTTTMTTTTTESTTTPTTTSTTTTPPTTTPPPVCPTPPESSFARVFGGTPVGDTCAVSGMLNFRSGSTQMCNGVLGYDTATQSNRMFITDFCFGFLEALIDALSVTAIGLYNSVPFQITDATLTTPAADQISKMEPPAGVLTESRCKTTACVYNPATMSSLIDYDTCFFTSFGYDIKIAETYSNSGTVKRVNVTKQTCTTVSVSPNAECFKAVNTNVRGCWGDNGAPVFCRLTSTQETVLYGLLDVIGQPPKEITGSDPLDMCADSSEFHVLPIS